MDRQQIAAQGSDTTSKHTTPVENIKAQIPSPKLDFSPFTLTSELTLRSLNPAKVAEDVQKTSSC